MQLINQVSFQIVAKKSASTNLICNFKDADQNDMYQAMVRRSEDYADYQ